MQDDIKASLHQVHDGCLPREQVSRVAEYLLVDSDARARLQRYSVIGDCLRGREWLASDHFVDQVMGRLDAEPEVEVASADVGLAQLPARGRRWRAWQRPVAYAAVFLTGAVLAFVLQPAGLPSEYADASRASGPAVEVWPADVRDADTLDQLLQVHGQASFGRYSGTGFLPYAPALVVAPPSKEQP
jgi:hypothetical protein